MSTGTYGITYLLTYLQQCFMTNDETITSCIYMHYNHWTRLYIQSSSMHYNVFCFNCFTWFNRH